MATKKENGKKIRIVLVVLLFLIIVGLVIFLLLNGKTRETPELASEQIDSATQVVLEEFVEALETVDFVELESEELVTETEEPEPPHINLVMIGDMLIHARVWEQSERPDGTYDFNHVFDYVRPVIEEADVAILNQETILGGTELGLSEYPSFNSPYEVGDAAVAAGFDVILSATNHTLDKGSKGMDNCLNFWKTNYPDIELIGLNASYEEMNQIHTIEKDGITIAILNYTYGTNGINPPSGREYCVNYLDKDKVTRDVEAAKEIADFVIVCPHWGTEYRLEPDSYQKQWCEWFLELGVDLVIGTHPHVIEPIEWYEREDGHRMLVYYSLGNFVNGTTVYGDVAERMVGGMADVTIGYDEDGNVVITDYGITPVICHEGEGDNYTVYPLNQYTEELADSNWIKEQDPNFSKEFCDDLTAEIWGEGEIRRDR